MGVNVDGTIDTTTNLALNGTLTLATTRTLSKAGAGTLDINGPVVAQPRTGFNANAGTTNLNVDVGSTGPTLTLKANSGGLVNANVNQLLFGLGADTGTGTYNTATSTTTNVHSTGLFAIAAGATLTKTGTGTLNINGVQNHGAGATFQVGGSDGGVVNMNTNPGKQANRDGLGIAASANLTLNVNAAGASDSSIVNLNATGETFGGATTPLGDTHVFKKVNMNVGGGSPDLGTAQIVLGAGDPFGLGAGGSVLLAQYSGGTAAGNAPSRADIEATWYAVASGYYFGLNGITTTTVTDPSKNGLGLMLIDDSLLGGPGATFLGVTEMILGDLNGDMVVDTNDAGILGALMDTGYNPANIGVSGMALAQVPEPAALSVLALGALGLLRRRNRR